MSQNATDLLSLVSEVFPGAEAEQRRLALQIIAPGVADERDGGWETRTGGKGRRSTLSRPWMRRDLLCGVQGTTVISITRLCCFRMMDVEQQCGIASM